MGVQGVPARLRDSTFQTAASLWVGRPQAWHGCLQSMRFAYMRTCIFSSFLANTYFVLQSSRKGHQATNAANGWTGPLIPVTDALEPLAWMPVDALQEHVPLALCLSRGKVFVYEN